VVTPDAPDPVALRRRVLLTGLLSFALFLVVAFIVSSAGVSDWWLVIAMVAVYGAVIRPLMAPVRNASRLRRSLAYQAFLDRKQDDA
jgi:type IV secretory pathway TrbD component